MRAEIQKLIDGIKTQGMKYDAYDLSSRLMDGDGEHVLTLVEMVLDQLPKAGTFFDDAVSFVPDQHLSRLATVAIEKLRKGGTQETAEDFIARCSLQQVEVLHPHLADIYELKPNWSTYYSDWPWRKSGLQDFENLRRVVEDASDAEAAEEAWQILLETRHPDILKYCFEHSELIGSERIEMKFREVGFQSVKGDIHQLYANEVHHLIFPEEFWNQEKTPNHLVKRHPTWRGSGMRLSSPGRFGGLGTHICSACGKPGHNLLSFTEVPKQFSTAGLRQIHFETCLSCLGWEVPHMFYRHESTGEVIPVGYKGERIVPQFPSEPFVETEVRLAATTRRWQWQDWALTNSRQNLHRFGGHPCWIQSADYLQCPLCQETMSFLFQLDSDLPVNSGNSKPSREFLWGSGGICYAHWCDRCKLSGYYWQCT